MQIIRTLASDSTSPKQSNISNYSKFVNKKRIYQYSVRMDQETRVKLMRLVREDQESFRNDLSHTSMNQYILKLIDHRFENLIQRGVMNRDHPSVVE